MEEEASFAFGFVVEDIAEVIDVDIHSYDFGFSVSGKDIRFFEVYASFA